MAERLRIKNIEISGFRAYKNNILLNFDSPLICLFGPNGAGKSSTLGAVEWCLFGEFASLPRYESRTKDELLNDFSERIRVRLTLNRNGESFNIQREKKRGKEKTDLSITEPNGQVTEGDAAEHRLFQILGLSFEDFTRAIYLHQEAIRGILVEDPKVRDEGMDRLLGLHVLHNILDVLQQKRIRDSIKEVQHIYDEVQEILKTKMKEVKKSLEDMKAQALSKGLVESQLSLPYGSKLSEGIFNELSKITNEFKITPPESIKISKSEDVLPATARIKRSIDTIRRTLSEEEKIKELNSQRLSFIKVRDNYIAKESALKDADKEVAEFCEKYGDKQSLKDRLKKLEDKIGEYAARHSSLDNKKTQLPPLFEYLESKTDFENFENQYGDEEKIQHNIKECERKIEKFGKERGKIGAKQKVIKDALDYLKEDSYLKECPICGRTISREELWKHLELEIEREINQKLKDIDDKIKEYKEKREGYEENSKEYRKLQKRAESAKRSAKEGILIFEEELRILEKTPLKERELYLGKMREDLEKEVQDVSTKLKKLRDEKDEKEGFLKKIERLLSDHNNAEKDLNKVLDSASQLFGHVIKPKENALKMLNERIKFFEGEIEKLKAPLKKVEEKLQQLEEEKEKLSSIGSYLAMKDRFERIEACSTSKEIQEIKEKIQELSKFGYLITQLSESVQESAVELASSLLKNSLPHIQEFYKRLTNHPYFTDLNIGVKPHVRAGSIRNAYNIIGLNPEDSGETTASQRFSTGQMNCVALSIFLALARTGSLSHNLDFMVLDDPSQNLDPKHKESLARILDEVGQKRQIILSTQDVEFQNILKSALSPKEKTILYDFEEWTKEGPKIR